MAKCLICENDITPFISFGRMPIANNFLTPGQFEREFFFELKAAFCPHCAMVQLAEQVDRQRMFHDQYAFFSSTSTRMAVHFKEFADSVSSHYLRGEDPFVVEIGSNDGIMLQYFRAAGIRNLGVEPSGNVAEAARQKGIETVCEFFDEGLARRIAAEHGQVDAVLGANVMCHIPYLHTVMEGVRLLLKPNGILAFEDPYVADIVEKTSYDQIYDEHAFYFSISSLSFLFERHGLELIDIQHQNVHGGSMRYVVAHKGAYPVSPRVVEQRSREVEMGLLRSETYDRLARNIERSRTDLVFLLQDLKARGKTIAGYAATSKSTTVLNYCGITPALLDYISDTTPLKQGKYSPGAHIPIRPYEDFKSCYPDYALLFGWNHMEEIMAKEDAFKATGGKWILYVPRVHIL